MTREERIKLGLTGKISYVSPVTGKTEWVDLDDEEHVGVLSHEEYERRTLGKRGGDKYFSDIDFDDEEEYLDYCKRNNIKPKSDRWGHTY